MKSASRSIHSLLRSLDVSHSFARALHPSQIDRKAFVDDLFGLRAVEAVVQHHDGTTGTHRQLVGDDYTKHMEVGTERGGVVLADTLSVLLTAGQSGQLSHDPDTLLGELAAGRSAVLVVQNPLGWDRTTVVSAAVPSANVSVTSLANGAGVPAQVLQETDGSYTLFARVTIPALGYASFAVHPYSDDEMDVSSKALERRETTVVENEHVRLQFSNTTNYLQYITDLVRPKITWRMGVKKTWRMESRNTM